MATHLLAAERNEMKIALAWGELQEGRLRAVWAVEE